MSSPRPSKSPAVRLTAVDALRGLVMVLMTVDHASSAFNAGRLMTDSVRSYVPGTPLDPPQFATRWITHLCAPTFVFLAGFSLALSARRRRARGESEAGQDRFLVTRGLFIAACDPLWMSLVMGPPGKLLFQVLYAIGASFVAMAALRRLPAAWLGALSVAMLVGHEALGTLVVHLSGGSPGPIAALLLTGGLAGKVVVAYPLVPWLAVMALGHVAADLFTGPDTDRLAARWAAAGAISLAIFAVVRGIDGYGNVGLHRADGSLLQWLHVSKYPPGLSFVTLELGIAALLLAAFHRVPAGSRAIAPLVLLGQTAFFFYLLHMHLMECAAHLLGLHRQAGLLATYAAAAVTVAVLLPLCARYRRYKAAHPDGWARYV